jgi:hypothetical protein
MDKTDIIGIVLALVITSLLMLLTLSLTNTNITGKATQNNQDPHSWTKAICDKNNYCQDYEIKCNGKTLISMTPITGAFIQLDADWQDPRSIEHRNRICD